MLDKFKYKIFEIGIPKNMYIYIYIYIYIEPKISVLCEAVPEIRKQVFFILVILQKIWCKHQNLRLLPSKFLNSMVYLCKMSCFCPDVIIYYIKSPHY